ncbi:MAG: SBBP repeat-containing protein, partial [Acidobacteria bacterium]|nr:SBBP repeat-containing protein [Acidobacteriota bacterium]
SGSVYLTGETHSPKFPSNATLRGPRNSEGDYDNGFITKLTPSGNAIAFNAYVGGSDADAGLSIAIDREGRAHVSGLTYSKDFPVTANALPIAPNKTLGASAFVSQIASNGMGLNFSTYLGGNATDYALGVAVDTDNNIFVTGRTDSGDFPVTGKFKSAATGKGDVFVTKINPEEGIVYSISFGGSQIDYGFGIAVDSYGSAVVIGKTSSPDFETVSALQPAMAGGRSDGFVAKVDPQGASLVFSTFLGGSGEDQALGVAVDPQEEILITGSTNSVDFPTVNAMQATRMGGAVARDAFVTKLNAAGSEMIYSTYLGGTGDDLGQSIGVDRAGKAYICGQTSSNDFPITYGAFQTTYAGVFDAFVTVLYPNGSPLLYSTYIGGKGEDSAVSLVVDLDGNAYIAGKTNSLNFPTTRNPFQAKIAGGQDAFVAKIVPLNQ